jgi:hypothetical protein
MPLKEELESAGCKIIREDENRIVVSCPVDVLEKGLRVEGAKSVSANREANEITLTIEKEREE